MLAHNIKGALRSLRRWPASSLTVVVVMALAIGGCGVAYSLFESVSNSLPFEDPEGLVLLWYQQKGQSGSHLTLSPAELRAHGIGDHPFEAIGGFRIRLLTRSVDGQTSQVATAQMTANTFDLLGRQAAVGRTFVEGEDSPGRDQVVVLSHAFWEQQLGALPGVVGSDLVLDGRSLTVVGVMPSDFELFLPAIQVFVPLVLAQPDLPRQVRDTLAVARLAPGQTLEAARAAVQATGLELQRRFPDSNRDYEVRLDFLTNYFPNPVIRNLTRSLTAAVVLVLLIACANVSNLMLSRGLRRSGETATRFALGASRSDVVGTVLIESLILSASGGIAGVLMVYLWADRVGSALGPLMAFAFNPEFDATLVLTMGAIAILAGCFFGSLPAFVAGRIDIVSGLKRRQGEMMGGLGRLLRTGSVVLQITLTLVLLAGATVMVGGFGELRRIDPRMDAEQVLISMVSVDRADQQTPQAQAALYDGFLAELRQLPGVETVALASSLPRSPFGATAPFDVGDGEVAASLPVALWVAVTPDYTELLNLDVLAGRRLQATDGAEAPMVAIISASTARRFWPGAAVVGRTFKFLGERREVVGVVPDVRQEFVAQQGRPLPVVYLPFSQTDPPGIHLLVRSGIDSATLSASLAAFEPGDARLTLGPVSTLSSSVQQFFSGLAVISQLLSGFGVLALGLAAFGVFGVISFTVSQRRREIGIRLALGSDRRGIQTLFLRQGMLFWLASLIVGVPGALAVHRLLSAVFFGVAPIQAGGLTTVAAVLLAAILLATWLAARRASRVDPIETLRE